MSRRRINDVELYHELNGHDGEPVVLVHGGWTDHSSWQLAAPGLSRDHRVLVYDRRGHSRSGRPAAQGSRRTDEDDLAALIEGLDLGPAHLIGNSYGASIVLGLAARRPELARSVVAHEPPLIGIAAPGSGLRATIDRIGDLLEQVAADLRRGELEQGACRFVEDVALGPGMWSVLPPETRRVMVANAATFLDVLGDPHWGAVPDRRGSEVPVLLTDGDASPDWLPAIVTALAAGPYAGAARHTFAGAGHVPHLTHAAAYLDVVERFIGQPPAREAGRAVTARQGKTGELDSAA